MPDDTFNLPNISAFEALRKSFDRTLTLVDLRKPDAVAKSGKRIAGALVRDPFAFDHQDPLTRATGQIAIFCVHGHEVSQFGCALMRVHGVDAVYIKGGFEAMSLAGANLETI